MKSLFFLTFSFLFTDVHLTFLATPSVSTITVPGRGSIRQSRKQSTIDSRVLMEFLKRPPKSAMKPIKEFPDITAPFAIQLAFKANHTLYQRDKAGLIFTCAQKIFGVSGMSIAIIRPLKPFCSIASINDYSKFQKNT